MNEMKMKKNVLVVDDMPENINNAKRAYGAPEYENFNFTYLSSYNDAIGLLETNRFDFVVTDLVMPKVGDLADQTVELYEKYRYGYRSFSQVDDDENNQTISRPERILLSRTEYIGLLEKTAGLINENNASKNTGFDVEVYEPDFFKAMYFSNGRIISDDVKPVVLGTYDSRYSKAKLIFENGGLLINTQRTNSSHNIESFTKEQKVELLEKVFEEFEDDGRPLYAYSDIIINSGSKIYLPGFTTSEIIQAISLGKNEYIGEVFSDSFNVEGNSQVPAGYFIAQIANKKGVPVGINTSLFGHHANHGWILDVISFEGRVLQDSNQTNILYVQEGSFDDDKTGIKSPDSWKKCLDTLVDKYK